MQAHAVADANNSESARQQLENLVTRLRGEETAGMTHAEVERLLQKEGAERLRRLYQGHLDARGIGTTTTPVVGTDGAAPTHARVSDREL